MNRLPAIGKKDISSLRSTLEYLREIGELVATDVEVDPHLEVAAIQKHFDGGAPLLFEKVKGSSIPLKQGTVIKNIRLVDGDAEHIEGHSDKIKGLVLKTCFLKKA